MARGSYKLPKEIRRSYKLRRATFFLMLGVVFNWMLGVVFFLMLGVVYNWMLSVVFFLMLGVVYNWMLGVVFNYVASA